MADVRDALMNPNELDRLNPMRRVEVTGYNCEALGFGWFHGWTRDEKGHLQAVIELQGAIKIVEPHWIRFVVAL